MADSTINIEERLKGKKIHSLKQTGHWITLIVEDGALVVLEPYTVVEYHPPVHEMYAADGQ